MIEIDDLRCFEAAANHLSFRAASRQVGLSAAAFSERIRRLEEGLGVQLFVRTTRSVRITPWGERLLPQARRTMAELQACIDLVRDGRPAPFSLTIGTRFELGMSWVMPSVEALAHARPEQTLHLHFSEGPAIVDALRTGHIDAVIGSMRLDSSRVETMPLHEERYCFVAAPGLVARQPLAEPHDAVEHTLVDTSPALSLFRYWSDQVPAGERWAFGKHQFLGAIAPIRHWVLAERGVAVLPEYFIREDLEAGRLERILTHVEARTDWFRLVWLKDHVRRRDLEALGRFLATQPLR